VKDIQGALITGKSKESKQALIPFHKKNSSAKISIGSSSKKG
jgi:hypothetical protein